jgi:hypothetical protein
MAHHFEAGGDLFCLIPHLYLIETQRYDLQRLRPQRRM